MITDPVILGTLITAVAGLLVGLLTVWMNDRSQLRKLVYDGQQGQIAALTVERTEIKASLAAAHHKVDLVLLQGRYKDDYINQLRSHIEQEKPPPPPPYPEALLRLASEGIPA